MIDARRSNSAQGFNERFCYECSEAQVQLTLSTIHSRHLCNEMRVWPQPPPVNVSADALCILLGGEYYVERMDAPAVIDELQRSQIVPPFAVAYVSHVDGQTRWKESRCNEHFARFVADELTPWVQRQFGRPLTPCR